MVLSEKGIRTSFAEVKADILELKDTVLRLAEQQEKLESLIKDSKPKKKPAKTSKKRK